MNEFFDREEILSFLLSGGNISQKEEETLREPFKPFRIEKKSWYDLRGKTFLAQTIHIKGCNYCAANVSPKFPNCEILFVEKCDKNLTYHELNSRRFPKLKTIYLHSHPCDYGFFYRRPEKIFMTSEYGTYKKRWAKDDDNVILIEEEEFRRKLAEYF